MLHERDETETTGSVASFRLGGEVQRKPRRRNDGVWRRADVEAAGCLIVLGGLRRDGAWGCQRKGGGDRGARRSEDEGGGTQKLMV